MADRAPTLDLPPGYQGLPLRTPTLPPATHTNCYVVGHRHAVVVDPGSAFPGEIARLAEPLYRLRGTGGTVAAVLLTHHHGDHIGGACALARRFDAPVAAHAETFRRVALDGDIERRALVEGQRLEVDEGWAIEVLHTPGHAPGHLCLHDPRNRALVVGDMVPGAGTTVIAPPDGEMATYLASLDRLAALGPRYLLPAHGPARRFGDVDGGARAIRALIAHRLMREARVVEALTTRRALDLHAVTRAAYPDVSPLVWSLASRSALAHLLKLEAEGRARRRGDRWSEG